MKIKSWIHYLWKVPLCGILFFIGFIPGGQLAAWMGMTAPPIPTGADQTTVTQYTILAGMILALCLAILARGLWVSFLWRWLILFLFTWLTYGVNNYLEASIFSTLSASSRYSVVLYLPAALLCAAAVAWLFPPDDKGAGFLTQTRHFFASRKAGSWVWRLPAAFLAFPLAYYFFGSLVSPIVLPYYLEGANQLALPGWDQIIPVLALRSLLFLLVCLPILIVWKLSDLRLFLTLGLALFLLVGGISMLYAYWLPPVLRGTHGLEILADEMVYAGALVFLLRPGTTQAAGEQIPVPVH